MVQTTAHFFMQGEVNFDFYGGFRFEAFWIKWPGFLETVKEAWSKPVNTQDAILRIHVKLLRTAKALKMWRRKKFQCMENQLGHTKHYFVKSGEGAGSKEL